MSGNQDANAAARHTLWRLLGDFPEERFKIARRKAFGPPAPGTRAERLDLASRDGSLVRALITGPQRDWRGLPTLLYCHAHGNRHEIGADELIEGRPALIAPPYAQALAELGFLAFCIDLPCFGERADAIESALAKRYLWEGRTLFGAMLAELVATIDLLSVMDEVDSGRIGVMGISMGATLAFWLGALDPRIKAIAHLCCFADLKSLIDGGGHDLHGIYMTVPGLLGQFSTGRIAGLAAPTPQIACVGLRDPLTPENAVRIAMADALECYQRASAEAAFKSIADPETTHRETPAMREAVLAFLVRHLHRAGEGAPAAP